MKNSHQLLLSRQSQTVRSAAHLTGRKSAPSREVLEVFSNIHKSSKFTLDAAHQLFGNLKRSK